MKKSDRFAGQFFASLVNGSHVPLTDWAFTHLEIPEGATAMDVGCGAGQTINMLAAKAAKVYGRVLKPGGRLMVVAENYKGARATMPCWGR